MIIFFSSASPADERRPAIEGPGLGTSREEGKAAAGVAFALSPCIIELA